MALRQAISKAASGITSSVSDSGSCFLQQLRCSHFASLPSFLDCSIKPTVPYPPVVLPESDPRNERIGRDEFRNPSFISSEGSMELMAVPRKKVSRHKRGIRNGPKALKPTPVIIRCRSCGRVKLPHFYCCSGDRGISSEQKE